MVAVRRVGPGPRHELEQAGGAGARVRDAPVVARLAVGDGLASLRDWSKRGAARAMKQREIRGSRCRSASSSGRCARPSCTGGWRTGRRNAARALRRPPCAAGLVVSSSATAGSAAARSVERIDVHLRVGASHRRGRAGHDTGRVQMTAAPGCTPEASRLVTTKLGANTCSLRVTWVTRPDPLRTCGLPARRAYTRGRHGRRRLPPCAPGTRCASSRLPRRLLRPGRACPADAALVSVGCARPGGNCSKQASSFGKHLRKQDLTRTRWVESSLLMASFRYSRPLRRVASAAPTCGAGPQLRQPRPVRTSATPTSRWPSLSRSDFYGSRLPRGRSPRRPARRQRLDNANLVRRQLRGGRPSSASASTASGCADTIQPDGDRARRRLPRRRRRQR